MNRMFPPLTREQLVTDTSGPPTLHLSLASRPIRLLNCCILSEGLSGCLCTCSHLTVYGLSIFIIRLSICSLLHFHLTFSPPSHNTELIIKISRLMLWKYRKTLWFIHSSIIPSTNYWWQLWCQDTGHMERCTQRQIRHGSHPQEAHSPPVCVGHFLWLDLH